MSKSRRIALAAVVSSAVLGACSSPALAASHCAPSTFHPTKTTLSAMRFVSTTNRLLPILSTWVYNPTSRRSVYTVNFSGSATISTSISASIDVKVSDVLTTISATAGRSVGRSTTVQAGGSFGVSIPAKDYGWAQAAVAMTTYTGTVSQVDMICNAVLRSGPITVTVPSTAVGYVPVVANHPR